MSRIIEEDVEAIKQNLLGLEKSIKGNTFLVTGGAGFLGSWFCDVLDSFGAKVICLDNLKSGSRKNIRQFAGSKSFKFINEDVCSFSINKKVDYIVHMACLASPPVYQKYPIETLDTNAIGTKNMLELARKNKAKGFLLASTSEVYGDSEKVPTPEDYKGNVNSYGPRSMYDEGKRVAEAYCYSYFQKHRISVKIARIFNTYGPRLDVKSTSQYGRALIKFVHQALNGKPITVYGDGSQTRSFCYITDQIEGLLKLLLKPGLDGEVVNIGSGEEISIIDLAKLVTRLAGAKPNIAFEKLPQDDPRKRCPDLSKAKRLLDYNPNIKLEEGLVRTMEWYRSLS